MRRIAAVALTVLLAVPALALATGHKSPLAGTYTAIVVGQKGASKGLNGKWTISIAPSGRYGIYKVGRRLVTGSTRIVGKRVTFADQGGPLRCKGSLAVGIYSWKINAGTLVLKPLSDLCTGRRSVLSTPLHRK